MPSTPEQRARELIDAALVAAGWLVQDRRRLNLHAAPGIALCETDVEGGFADYMLFVDAKAIGVLEAKAAGIPLVGVAEQSELYARAALNDFQRWNDPLPFTFESNGEETRFRNMRDPRSRSRFVFGVHRPETLRSWIEQPDTFRNRLQKLPPLHAAGLRDCQVNAVNGLEKSLARNDPRAQSRWPQAKARPGSPSPNVSASSISPARAASFSSWRMSFRGKQLGRAQEGVGRPIGGAVFQDTARVGRLPGLSSPGIIFAKAQKNMITDPAKLERLISMMESENWAGLDMDVKGEIYEGLPRNAEGMRAARPLFHAAPYHPRHRAGMRPDRPCASPIPRAARGSSLRPTSTLAKANPSLDRKTQRFINEEALHGTDIVPSVTRLCAMNLYLHGLGGSDRTIVETADSLAKRPAIVDMVLTNPPFGKKSSITVINDEGKRETEKIYYERQDFWATTSNKQLNFVQNVYSMLTETGTAAVVVPDNVLFEAGAGEKIRRTLLECCNVHTLLRLPTGIWYSPGVKANVLFFFDKKPAAKTPQTKELWVYDLRTNRNFTLRQNPIADEDLKEFVQCYQTTKRGKREESDRFKRFTYADLMARDKANLNIFWLKDDSLADTENLPKPAVLAAEIVEDLEEALEEFSAVEEELKNGETPSELHNPAHETRHAITPPDHQATKRTML